MNESSYRKSTDEIFIEYLLRKSGLNTLFELKAVLKKPLWKSQSGKKLLSSTLTSVDIERAINIVVNENT